MIQKESSPRGDKFTARGEHTIVNHTNQKTSTPLPQRRSIRLPSYDYDSTGAYFVTLCTDQRIPYFEETELRHILEAQWYDLPQRFPGITLDEFVIMPDHLHFIIWLNRDEGSTSTLGAIVGAYKSLVKVAWGKYIKATGHPPYQGSFWQSSYQERVLRNEFEVDQKRVYIRNNPLKRALIRGELRP